MGTPHVRHKLINRRRRLIVIEANCAPDLTTIEIKDIINRAVYQYLSNLGAANSCILTKIHVVTSGSFQDAE